MPHLWWSHNPPPHVHTNVKQQLYVEQELSMFDIARVRERHEGASERERESKREQHRARENRRERRESKRKRIKESKREQEKEKERDI